MSQVCEEKAAMYTSDYFFACKETAGKNVQIMYGNPAIYTKAQETACSSTTTCNNNGICDPGESWATCPGECNPCIINGVCESQNGETYDNCHEDCLGGEGTWTSQYSSNLQLTKGFLGTEFAECLTKLDSCFAGCSPYEGSSLTDCASNVKDCYMSLCGTTWYSDPQRADCFAYGDQSFSLVAAAQDAYDAGRSVGCYGPSEPICNNDGICQEGESTEGCTDCPRGCNNNGICETGNAEDAWNCPTDCKDSGGGGGTDYSTATWTSQWNSALTAQQGYGYHADWTPCYQAMELCWARCGEDFGKCVDNNYPVCARNMCNVYGDSVRTECINTLMMIDAGTIRGEQASFAYGSAQASGCGGRRLRRR
jgi:hypothetical protein